MRVRRNGQRYTLQLVERQGHKVQGVRLEKGAQSRNGKECSVMRISEFIASAFRSWRAHRIRKAMREELVREVRMASERPPPGAWCRDWFDDDERERIAARRMEREK